MVEPALMPFCRLVELHTGIHLDASKQYLMESRLAPLAQQQGQTVPGLLLTLIRTPVGPLHHRAFEALATHETQFFRDPAFFKALADHLIPALIAQARAHKALRICCAGVSTGQEAYSVAILLHERFPELRDWNVLIQATDLSAAALDMARVLNHVLRHLQCPGGVLALGATESLGGYGALKPVQFGQLCCYTHA